MDVDSPPEHRRLNSRQYIVFQRLSRLGVPKEYLDQSWPGLVAFVRGNKSLLPQIASCLLPSDADVSKLWKSSKPESERGNCKAKLEVIVREGLLWLQWLMFEDEPHEFLKNLVQKASDQRAVCGAVWGKNDLAYCCRTCEHDSTCAICLPCFQNGNHKDHDYSIIYAGGGCCDCGDVTAWKREGFCSRHKGSEQIQPLPDESVNSIGPVLDVLFQYWKDKMLSMECCRPPSEADYTDVHASAYELSAAIIEMLLYFCNCSEGLRSLICKKVYTCSGLLDVLLMGERFLDKKVVEKLHELLLKFLTEPLFKYEFGKVFARYYQICVKEVIQACSDKVLEDCPLTSTFSVQIFTVPTLAAQLVQDVNLLGILLGSLSDLLRSCEEKDGNLQATKWANMWETTIRLIEDIRYVLSHEEVLQYIFKEQVDISKSWIQVLSLVQGMDAQKRILDVHVEEEYENQYTPFVLGHSLGNVNMLLVDGAFSLVECKERNNELPIPSSIQGSEDNDDRLRHAKAGRLAEESFAGKSSGKNFMSCELSIRSHFKGLHCTSIPSLGIWLVAECLKAIETWLAPDIANKRILFSTDTTSSSCHNSLSMRKKLFKIKKDGNNNIYRTSVLREATDVHQLPICSENDKRLGSSSSTEVIKIEGGEASNASSSVTDSTDMCGTLSEDASMTGISDDKCMEIDSVEESETLGLLNLAYWPDIIYDVSSQEVSFHIPLHRLLSALFQKELRGCYAGLLEKVNSISLIYSYVHHQEFFGKILGDFHPYSLSALVMEHPLRLRVFCSQVRAGMWHRNGDAALLSSECYRSVRWLEQGLESDLFLLQCCAALAPPELFILRIQERFGLSSYLSYDLSEHNEHEPILVQEMLTLIIQIVKERRFCGLSTVENLRRELIYRLAIGDATHSQLVKALPDDLSKSDQLQKVIDMVAVYSKPSGIKQGKYSLRASFWTELDLYHPRWNSMELQIAEDRYLRFCGNSAANVLLPQWSEIFPPLGTISAICSSRIVVQIIRAVLYYAFFAEASSANRAPDSVVITALHLLSLALDVCEKSNQACPENPGSNVDASHLDKHSFIGASSNPKDSFPLLIYACEEFDVGAAGAHIFWKKQNMLSLLVSLMRKYKEENTRSYTEVQQCDISLLIENLLKKFAHLNDQCKAEIRWLVPDLVDSTSQQSSKAIVKDLASDSIIDERKAKIRERQVAILEKMRAEQSKFVASLKATSNDEPDALNSKLEPSIPDVDIVSGEPKPTCSFCRDSDSQSPLFYLILLQRSRLTSFVERGPPSWEDAGKSAEAHFNTNSSANTAHSLQTVGLRFSNEMEPGGDSSFVGFFKDQLPECFQPAKIDCDAGVHTISSLEMLEYDIYHSLQRITHSKESHLASVEENCKHFTPLSSEGLKKSKYTDGCVLNEYIASLSRAKSQQNQSATYSFLQFPNTLSNSSVPAATRDDIRPEDFDGIHISSCGHAVHQKCYNRYLVALKQRSLRRLQIGGMHIVNTDMGELLCPVCRRFANSILPVDPFSSSMRQRLLMPSSSCTKSLDVSTSSDLSDNVLLLPLALTLLQSTAKMVGQGRFLKSFSGKLGRAIGPALEPATHTLCLLHYPRSYGRLITSDRHSQSLMLWNTLAYSLMSLEIAAREKMNACSAGSVSGLESLYGELHSSNGSILSFLLLSAQASCTVNCLEVLLRFRAIQLFAESICFGVSGDIDSPNTEKQRGTYYLIPEYINGGEVFPDIQLWRRTADPILTYDPFSSLMLVLFSLPLPCVHSTEFFMALVHLFYIVSVIQSLITCYSSHQFDLSCFGDWMVDFCKTIGETELTRKHFLSNYIDSSCHPKDMIRRFTLPYLRRCALLWHLIKSSKSSSPDSSHTWEGLISSQNNDSVGDNKCPSVELTAVGELENMFQICSLESILKDELVHTLTYKWCQHFCEKFKVHKAKDNYYCTPAVPFRLIKLPRLYQDLLERYANLQCPHCNSVAKEPALCLLCGRLCSSSWNYCCRESRCSDHAKICGAGIGVFLLVRKTTILLLRSVREALWPSPYLDAYGEEDLDMRRGRPLYLNEERYGALAYLVASHSLDYNSEVLRRTTVGLFDSDLNFHGGLGFWILSQTLTDT